jgi:hypothetical protein
VPFAVMTAPTATARRWGKRRPVVEPVARPSRKQYQEATLAGRRAVDKVPAPDLDALRQWYAENLQARLSRMHPTEIALGAAMGRSYAYYIVAGTRIPHPRHVPSLAALVGVELPKEFAAALFGSHITRRADSTGRPSPSR